MKDLWGFGWQTWKGILRAQTVPCAHFWTSRHTFFTNTWYDKLFPNVVNINVKYSFWSLKPELTLLKPSLKLLHVSHQTVVHHYYIHRCLFVCLSVRYPYSCHLLNRLVWNLASTFDMITERQLDILAWNGCIINDISHNQGAQKGPQKV